ncbi:MAG: EamA/RhaT family transporter [Bacteroidota bacterium]|nr:EamA/RhaT family transporter [Bacteroidota bacterium]
MIDILITIITFSFMLMLFKYFGKYQVNNLQAIIINYFTAGSLAVVITNTNGLPINFQHIVLSNYIVPSLIIGLLFIITFNLLAYGTQKIGIAISTVANKMSMIIPVIIGIYLFKEAIGVFKLIGIFLAISAIYMTSTKSGKLSFDKKFMPIILLIFLGQGIADGTLSWTQKFTLSTENTSLFFASTFFSAGTFGCLFLVYDLMVKKIQFQAKNILWGIALGVPNYLTLHFFIRSLQSPILESSQVFPVVNMGIIILSAISGIILFKEKLTPLNWTGIAIAIIAISFISFF